MASFSAQRVMVLMQGAGEWKPDGCAVGDTSPSVYPLAFPPQHYGCLHFPLKGRVGFFLCDQVGILWSEVLVGRHRPKRQDVHCTLSATDSVCDL